MGDQTNLWIQRSSPRRQPGALDACSSFLTFWKEQRIQKMMDLLSNILVSKGEERYEQYVSLKVYGKLVGFLLNSQYFPVKQALFWRLCWKGQMNSLFLIIYILPFLFI